MLCEQIQSLPHVIYDCPLTECVRATYTTNNLEEFFSNIKDGADSLLVQVLGYMPYTFSKLLSPKLFVIRRSKAAKKTWASSLEVVR